MNRILPLSQTHQLLLKLAIIPSPVLIHLITPVITSRFPDSTSIPTSILRQNGSL